MSPPDDSGFLPPHGNYQELLSFQKAEIVYDITFRFAHKYLSRGDRTVDQMIQSARSGKKNILEGSKAAVTSKEMEIKHTGEWRRAAKPDCIPGAGTHCGSHSSHGRHHSAARRQKHQLHGGPHSAAHGGAHRRGVGIEAERR